MIRPLAALFLAALLAGCSPSEGQSTGGGQYAGLDGEILKWRTAIEASHPACSQKVSGHGCEGFEVTCKAEQTITPDEAKAGVNAKVVAAMTFNGRNSDGSTGKPGSAFAYFAKSGAGWTRSEAAPVNMSTCARL